RIAYAREVGGKNAGARITSLLGSSDLSKVTTGSKALAVAGSQTPGGVGAQLLVPSILESTITNGLKELSYQDFDDDLAARTLINMEVIRKIAPDSEAADTETYRALIARLKDSITGQLESDDPTQRESALEFLGEF